MKDYTREILLEKYGHSIPAPAQEQQPQTIHKAASEFPVIIEYESIGLWLKAVVAVTRGWPEDIRAAVVSEQIRKHWRTTE